jgi:hypothetical protein
MPTSEEVAAARQELARALWAHAGKGWRVTGPRQVTAEREAGQQRARVFHAPTVLDGTHPDGSWRFSYYDLSNEHSRQSGYKPAAADALAMVNAMIKG